MADCPSLDMTTLQNTHSSLFCGEILAIYIGSKAFEMVNEQSCDFHCAIIEYADKCIYIEHAPMADVGTYKIQLQATFAPQEYKYVLKSSASERICFDRCIFSEDGSLESIAFRWEHTWLFFFTSEYDLILTRSSCDMYSTALPETAQEPILPIYLQDIPEKQNSTNC